MTLRVLSTRQCLAPNERARMDRRYNRTISDESHQPAVTQLVGTRKITKAFAQLPVVVFFSPKMYYTGPFPEHNMQNIV